MHESANLDKRVEGSIANAHAFPDIGSRLWLSYLITVATTFVVLLAAYAGVLTGLQQTGNLPPPSIVNEICADEKLRWLRDNTPESPITLLIGSSITFRNVDAGQLALLHASAQPLNGGICHLQVNQTAFVTHYFLRHFPSIQTVIAVLVPQDLTTCAKTPAQLFDPATADAYVFERRWPYRFYFSQLDFVSLIRNASRIKELREGRDPLDNLVITRYGDGPLDTEVSRGLTYGKLEDYDPACFAALHDLAKAVTSGGRRFVVATGPLSPAWTARYDPNDYLRSDMIAGIRAALHGTGAEFWDGDKLFAGAQSEFTDAIHIRWSAARRYGAMLAAALDSEQERP